MNYFLTQPAAAVTSVKQRLAQTVTTPAGELVSIHSLLGNQPLLINFWATWCAPCRAEMPLLNQFARQHNEIKVIGIALDRPDAVLAFISNLQISYPQYINFNQDLVSWGDAASVLPFTVLLDRDGIIKRSKLGPFKGQELDRWASLD